MISFSLGIGKKIKKSIHPLFYRYKVANSRLRTSSTPNPTTHKQTKLKKKLKKKPKEPPKKISHQDHHPKVKILQATLQKMPPTKYLTVRYKMPPNSPQIQTNKKQCIKVILKINRLLLIMIMLDILVNICRRKLLGIVRMQILVNRGGRV